MKENNNLYKELRLRYPEFHYEAYHHQWTAEGLRVWFDFRMGDVHFCPEALVEERPFLNRQLPTELLNRLAFDIGMIELISYWKCACPPLVRVDCGHLDENQVSFWRKLYWHGLGEFFYTNAISATFDTFLQLSALPPTSADAAAPEATPAPLAQAYLVPIGGGKDSVVTLELLRRAGKAIRPLIMNPRGATVECARVAGFPMDQVLVIRRKIDPTLLDLNAQGYLNGHTPFSAMLAFYTRLASALTGIPNVALSNENSANESTVLGSDVNHQYSKSLEFEDDFRHYCEARTAADHLPAFNYFSFLRPLSELQIAMLFSRFTQYHDVFRSCNVGSKQDIWCGHCAKCLFAYIILSPFIAPSRLDAIFGKPMLSDLTLRTEFLQLLGLEATKPFECVGTVGEVRQALAMALGRWYPEGKPALLSMPDLAASAPIVPAAYDAALASLASLSPLGHLSSEERQILQAACTAKNN